MKPIINKDSAESTKVQHGEHFEATMTHLASAVGASTIGANITTVPPGKAAFPLHHHYANEEHFYVLSGTGKVRIGEDVFDIRPGDYVFNAPGGPEHAHQMINTGSEDLVYLAISTKQVPEVVGYPDSHKTGVRIKPTFEDDARFLIEDANKNTVTYWDGEDGAEVVKVLKGR
ncbi:cupin domain-containing protein [Kordiimonas gwangyangensis]|uniref:cupin domain-containing protein n=1 Tax=Kordiimonas gwangyangensis TaxID=288022 RepID=UPI00036B0C99|nr:cupin domain-containing protein [Kordiimonas gwangyangensis]